MRDLRIWYDNENDKRICREYKTIMDFIDEMESDNIDIPVLDYSNVHAVFFESKLDEKYFNSINELLEHCKKIVA